ncbi:unnamed protein product [Diatraea saccharalis]|uniref:Uncharacterized protein n=1 Tax=Diatraea saccharalis TaxID=40085 RepID=A0A9N9R8E8_9NEOP|nr:unnamed protein product [Diatraea saccharalis]
MFPLTLEGETLGKKHRHYNTLVKTAATAATYNLENIRYDDEDINNLFKVDVACARRNVQYILEVLKGGDILYVSRALRHSVWLLCDDRYAHIINPRYLHQELFPQMTTKTKTKLLLQIRLHLKNSDRAEDFFKYYCEDDVVVAQKFLPLCSIPFIENAVQQYIHKLRVSLLVRLCKKSISILRKYIESSDDNYFDRINILTNTRFLCYKNPKEYFDVLDSLNMYHIPKFGIKLTKSIMKSCPERIVDRYERYYINIHDSTFAKYLKREQIIDFLRMLSQGSSYMWSWSSFDHLSLFFRYLPHGKRFEYVKKIFIDNEAVLNNNDVEEDSTDKILLRFSSFPSCDIYHWYRLAPFEIAFPELTEKINIESKPDVRYTILSVLLHCAARNPEHIHTLLKYYYDQHVNETFKYKIQFINKLISRVHVHRLNEKTWNVLDDIFRYMEVYIESENKVQFCIQAIIVYNLIRDRSVPSVVEEKFIFNTLKDYRKKLNEYEQNKLFSYLFSYISKKIETQTITRHSQLVTLIQLLENVFELLEDWKKNLRDYPLIIKIIKKVIKIKMQNLWDTPLTNLYKEHKTFRKYLFEESFFLYPSDAVCLNALKHDPSLLSRHTNEVDVMCCNDSMSLKYTLRKLRIYWPRSIAQEWINKYVKRFRQLTGHKASLEGLCIILPREQINYYLKEFIPVETRIMWNEDFDEVSYKLSKNTAAQLYKIRPPVEIDVVLQFARDDYLQYALPSLQAILYNMSHDQSIDYASKLLKVPVSLQKITIRSIMEKMNFDLCKPYIVTLWAATNNTTVKGILFKQLFKFLCMKRNYMHITEILGIMNSFIDKMSLTETGILRYALKHVSEVPLKNRPFVFQKCYLQLRLFKQEKLESFREVLDIIDLIDATFIEDVLLNSFRKYLGKKCHVDKELEIFTDIFALYLLTCKFEETQTQRFERVFIPVFEVYLTLWSVKINKERIFRKSFEKLLHKLIGGLRTVVEKKFIMPIYLFNAINNVISKRLCLGENYSLLTILNMVMSFVEVLNNYLNDNSIDILEVGTKVELNNQWHKLCIMITPLLGKSLINLFDEFVPSINQLVHSLLTEILWNVFDSLDFPKQSRYLVLKSMLVNPKVIACYYVVINVLRRYHCSDSNLKAEIKEIIEKNSSSGVKALFWFNETDFDCVQFDE